MLERCKTFCPVLGHPVASVPIEARECKRLVVLLYAAVAPARPVTLGYKSVAWPGFLGRRSSRCLPGPRLICVKYAPVEFIILAIRHTGDLGLFASRCYNLAGHTAGNEVKFRRMRYLTFFMVAMFFASNAAAAIGACIVNMTGQEHTAVGALVVANEDLCPESDGTSLCTAHYAQSHQNEAQEYWVDFTPVASVPVLAVVRVPFQGKPRLLAAASMPPIVGPSLTILYQNFRN